MLKVAEEKYNQRYYKNKLEFIQKDVMELDYDDNSIDAIFMAYGIRNMPDYSRALKNLFRILKTGGKIAFHEYSLKNNYMVHLYWKLLGYGIIIPVSKIMSGSSTIFKYLLKSLDQFLSPTDFTKLLREIGFINIQVLMMPTWPKPILSTFTAIKPNEAN